MTSSRLPFEKFPEPSFEAISSRNYRKPCNPLGDSCPPTSTQRAEIPWLTFHSKYIKHNKCYILGLLICSLIKSYISYNSIQWIWWIIYEQKSCNCNISGNFYESCLNAVTGLLGTVAFKDNWSISWSHWLIKLFVFIFFNYFYVYINFNSALPSRSTGIISVTIFDPFMHNVEFQHLHVIWHILRKIANTIPKEEPFNSPGPYFDSCCESEIQPWLTQILIVIFSWRRFCPPTIRT